MDRFFRVRVVMVFAMLGVAISLLAFATSTRSMAENGRVPIVRTNEKTAIDELAGTSEDPMDTMGVGAETQNGTSSPAFATDEAQRS